jgi:hypothetical protein
VPPIHENGHSGSRGGFEKNIIVLKNVLQPHLYLVAYWDLLYGACRARKSMFENMAIFRGLGVISWRVPPARQLISLGGRAWPPNPLPDFWCPESKMWFYTG